MAGHWVRVRVRAGHWARFRSPRLLPSIGGRDGRFLPLDLLLRYLSEQGGEERGSEERGGEERGGEERGGEG